MSLYAGSLDVLKRELLKFQVQASTNTTFTTTTTMIHPKLSELSRLVLQWLQRRSEGTGKGKVRLGRRGRGCIYYARCQQAVIVVAREFQTLSGEITGHLQSIANLKSCAFSLVPDGTLDPLYLETVENRWVVIFCMQPIPHP